ncbi:MAG TPA: hypothetical protein VIY47_01775, partial [Ignavibacteriaceae bacterium]
MENVFPVAVPDRAGWAQPEDMKNILNVFFDKGWQIRLPFGKVLSSSGVSPVSFAKAEDHCYEVGTPEGTVIFSPGLLRFEKVLGNHDHVEYL